jgi:acyl transferase domain-containing protein
MSYNHTNGTGSESEEDAIAPIAVVAMACRFPGDATSPSHFWDMLSQGRAAWSEVPKTRFNAEAFWHPSNGRSGTMTAKGGHFMTEDVTAFDAPVCGLPLPAEDNFTNKDQFCN